MATSTTMQAVSSSSALCNIMFTGSKQSSLARNVKVSAVAPSSSRRGKVEANKGEWLPGLGSPAFLNSTGLRQKQKRSVVTRAAQQEQETTEMEKQEEEQERPKVDVEETTRKLGLEAGLWQIFTSKEKDKEGAPVSRTTQAKDLLTRYGGAYLATSISLSLVSFGLCYVLVSNGVDVTALLEKVGIHANETGEKVGTFALAYAAHKAASPIRFPPTVALTPIVAGWFGKKSADAVEDEKKP